MSGDVTLRKEFNRLTASVGMRTNSYDYRIDARAGRQRHQPGRPRRADLFAARPDRLCVLSDARLVRRRRRQSARHPRNARPHAGFARLSRAVRRHGRLEQSDHRRVRRRLCPAAFRRSDDRHDRRSFLSRAADMAPDPPARRALQCRTDRHANLRHQFDRRARQRGAARPRLRTAAQRHRLARGRI